MNSAYDYVLTISGLLIHKSCKEVSRQEFIKSTESTQNSLSI